MSPSRLTQRSPYSLSWPAVIALVILAYVNGGSAAPVYLPEWIEELTPKRGKGIRDELTCYALPYGAIGFVSHVLTYYTIIALSFGRMPWWPKKRLEHGKWDMIIAIMGVIVSLLFAAFTIVRCRQRWQFILIAVWKTVMTITLGAISIQTGMVVHRSHKQKRQEALDKIHFTPVTTSVSTAPKPELPITVRSIAPRTNYAKPEGFAKALYWLYLYIPSTIVGLVGLISLILQHWDDPEVGAQIREITSIFAIISAGVSGIAILGLLLIIHCGGSPDDSEHPLKDGCWGEFISAVCVFIPIVGVLAASYSDWVLAALAGNITGVPSKDHSLLYYGFFLSKRLPMFSF